MIGVVKNRTGVHTGQTLKSQLEELGKAGCSQIYSEKISGAKCDRPELQRLLKALEPGSVIVVTRLDRLGRSTIDLLTIVKQIADRGCLFRSLADPWADTTTPAGRLMLTVLGGLAEFESELIKARTTEGRERAKRAGVKMGRKPLLSPHQIAEIRGRKAAGKSVRIPGSILWREPEYDISGQISSAPSPIQKRPAISAYCFRNSSPAFLARPASR